MIISGGKSRYFFLVVLAMVLAVFAAMVSVPSAARADTQNINGAVSASDPTFNHLHDACETNGGVAHYKAYVVTIAGTSATTLAVTVNPSGFRANLTVYQSGFLPDTPIANCFGTVTGSAVGAAVNYSINLNPPLPPFDTQSFTVVVAGNTASDVGNFSASISSNPLPITVTPIVSGPSDSTAPVVTVPSTITKEATGATGAVATYSASATDNVDGVVTPNCAPASGSTFPIGNTTVNCSSTDSSSNTGSNSFHVVVQDTTGPSLSLPGTTTAQATGPSGAAVTFTATANDIVDGSRPVSCTPASGSTFALGNTTVICSATDTRGNSSGNGSFTVSVSDSAGPVVTVPANITREASSHFGDVAVFNATANDAVDGPEPVTCLLPSGSLFPISTTTVTCSAVDSHGNQGTASFTVTVQDTTAPTLSLPAPAVVEATGPDGAVVDSVYGATDLVDTVAIALCNAPSGNVYPVGVTVVDCSAVDSHGNIAHGSFSVTVNDTTAPTLSLPGDFTAEATSAAGAPVSYTATSADVVDGSVPVICSPASGATFALGATPVDCTATDAHGNVAHGSFSVTVGDATAPALSLPADITAEATDASGAKVTYTATASDLVDGTVPVSCSPASGATFALGVATVTCSATDSDDNVAEDSFTVTVSDTTAPAITVPIDLRAEATGPDGTTVTYSATASDAVDGTDAVTCTPASGSVFPLGSTPVSCDSTDAAGNTAHSSFDLLVGDSTGPVLSLPADITADATGASGATVAYSATASDLVDGTVAVSCTPASGSTFGFGVTTVDCSATDAHANTSTGSFTVTVDDTTGPVLTLPGDLTAEATSASGATVSYTATSSDLVDGTVPVSCDHASGATFALGATTVDCSATDDNDNTSTGSFTVTVEDTTAPIVTTVTADPEAEATGPDGAVVTFPASATDAVDGTDVVTCSTPSGSVFPLGHTAVNCSATDAAGNTAHSTFTVTVADTTAPALALPTADVTAEATGPDGAVVQYEATATDLVDGTDDVSCTPASGGLFEIGTTAIDCETTDAAGNTASGAFSVVVSDTTGPVITVPSAVTVDATSPDGAVATFTATALDAVNGSVAVTCTPASGSLFPVGATTVTCTATDPVRADDDGPGDTPTDFAAAADADAPADAPAVSTASFVVTVNAYVPPADPNAPNGSSTTTTPSSLADTGSRPQPLLAGSLVLFLGGGLLVLLTARRRRSH